MTDPYVYPDTNTLINKRNIHDFDKLQKFERLFTTKRMREPLPEIPLTYEGYKAIHHHIFQDVYEWAGQSRTVSLAKGETFFGPPDHVDSQMQKRFELLKKEKNLKGLSPEKFAATAAAHMNEINAIHPFREGNGRTQRLFLKELARQSGHHLSLQRIKPEPWHKASVRGFAGNNGPMQDLIKEAITGRDRTHSDAREQQVKRFKEKLTRQTQLRSKEDQDRGR